MKREVKEVEKEFDLKRLLNKNFRIFPGIFVLFRNYPLKICEVRLYKLTHLLLLKYLFL